MTKKVLLYLLATASLIACNKEPENFKQERAFSTPKKFATESELVSAINELREADCKTKSSDNSFMSFYSSVMQEENYDDRPNAIYSEAFGSILNQDGEVFYGSTMIKVGNEGVFYGPATDSLAVRFVANMSNISSLCQKENCPYISNKNSQESYSISGYDGIYVFDTFGLIEGWGRTIAENDSNETDIATKVYVDGEYQELNTNALELFGGTGMAADWRKSFVKPKSGNQKVKFSDKKHCNDTKIYQQNYGVDSDDGVKTKTMKKRLGTIWDKVNGPLEAAIKNISLYVQADFTECTKDDICHMKFVNREFDVYVKQARGTSANWVVGLNNTSVISEISRGEQFAKEHNISSTPSAVMYVLNNEVAVVRFLDKFRYESNNSVMIIKWRTPFGGDFAAKNSRMNGSWKTAGIYHVEKLDAYGCSIRGDVRKGSMMHYTYNKK